MTNDEIASASARNNSVADARNEIASPSARNDFAGLLPPDLVRARNDSVADARNEIAFAEHSSQPFIIPDKIFFASK